MSINSDITTALYTQVEVAAAAVNLPVKFPNIPFTSPDNNRYLDVTHFRNDPDPPLTWDGTSFYVGILQINLVIEAGVGDVLPTNICDQIAGFFEFGTVLRSGNTAVKIEQKPGVLTAIENGQTTLYPVSVRYRCSSA